MKLPIRKYGDPVLREKAKPITKIDAAIHKLADDMLDTMHAAEGVGLAAQQIGETRAICIIMVPPDLDKDEAGEPQHSHLEKPVVLLNPVITESSRTMSGREEGCLSFPEIRGSIQRPTHITLKYTGLDGVERIEKLRDFAARVVLHEVDHLNGILFIDKFSPAKKFAVKRKLANLRADTEEELALR